MRYLTMVKRAGNPKASANAMTYTLIGDDMSVHVMTGDKLAKELADKKIVVTNMGLSAKGLVSTNGALDRYTTIDENNMLVGEPRAVILNRIEVNGEVKQYTIFTPDGTISRAPALLAGQLAANGKIANGKVRNVEGGAIVAAIGGSFPIYNVEAQAKETKVEKPTVELIFVGKSAKEPTVEYAGAIIGSKNAEVASKVYSVMLKKNEDLIAKMRESVPAVNHDKFNGFAMRQVNGMCFYGVFPLDSILDLCKKAGSYKAPKNGLMVACTDYSVDGCEESTVIVDKAGNTTKVQAGSEVTEKKMNPFMQKAVQLVAASHQK